MSENDGTIAVPLPPYDRHRDRRHVKGFAVKCDNDRQELVLVLDVEGKGGEELPLIRYSLSHKAAARIHREIRARLAEYVEMDFSEDD